jgi:hypothetical protein
MGTVLTVYIHGLGIQSGPMAGGSSKCTHAVAGSLNMSNTQYPPLSQDKIRHDEATSP